MKLEILKEELKKALLVCERITRKALGLPILQNVLIKAENNLLELTTTNLETTIKFWVLARVKKAGELTAPASLLSSLVNLVASDKVELLEESGNLVVLAQNQENQLPTQNSQDFPIIPKMENADLWQVSVDNLTAGLAQLVEIPATSQLHPSITGLLFSFKKGQLTLVATDSFRLAEKNMPVQKDGQKDGSFILPQAVGRELLNILGAEQGSVNIHFNANQAMFELLSAESGQPRLRVQSRLVEGDYPKYQEIIPQSSSTQIRVDRELLANQIKQAGLFSGKVAEVRLKTIVKEGRIRVTSQSSEMGRSESYLLGQINGAEVEIAFNYRFLLAGLAGLKSSEVILELGGFDRAGVIRPVGDASCLYLLMPLQTS